MPPDPVHPVSPRRLRFYGGVAILVLAAVVAAGLATRSNSDARLREWTDAQAIPSVAVALPAAKPLDAALELPGRLEAYSRAPIYARVSGYLKSWNVDIGTPVKAGQLLAEIEAPDLDQQLMQARADLANSQAAAKLSAATLARRKTLLASNFVSQQEIDERSADLASKEAQVKAQQANVARLEALAGYKNVTAPFDGVVTERNTDVGALINGGTGAGAAMFVVSDVKKLRLYVNVPQSYMPSIRIGAKASVTVPEYPGRTFPATIEASSQSVDVASGTTRVQLAIENTDNALRPGAYATVRLALTRDVQPLSIPASALIFNNAGLRVATVSAGDKVQFKTVTIARDLGREIEIATGLAPDDRVIITPLDGIAEGDQVRIAGGGNDGTPRTSANARTRTE
jgi:RND family efflux transporter MFP subunit